MNCRFLIVLIQCNNRRQTTMADESRANFQELYLNQYLVKSNNSTTKILVRQFIFETKRCAGCLMALDYFVAFNAIVLFLEMVPVIRAGDLVLETFWRAEEYVHIGLRRSGVQKSM
jgi:hypothetical protein